MHKKWQTDPFVRKAMVSGVFPLKFIVSYTLLVTKEHEFTRCTINENL